MEQNQKLYQQLDDFLQTDEEIRRRLDKRKRVEELTYCNNQVMAQTHQALHSVKRSQSPPKERWSGTNSFSSLPKAIYEPDKKVTTCIQPFQKKEASPPRQEIADKYRAAYDPVMLQKVHTMSSAEHLQRALGVEIRCEDMDRDVEEKQNVVNPIYGYNKEADDWYE